jgi:hypothetical protein
MDEVAQKLEYTVQQDAAIQYYKLVPLKLLQSAILNLCHKSSA